MYIPIGKGEVFLAKGYRMKDGCLALNLCMRTRYMILTTLLFIARIASGCAPPDTALKMAPYFAAKTQEGKTINVTAQKGKVVFINFWALSCIPCKEEMPGINALHEHYKNDTNVLVIPVDLDKNANSLRYMREQGFGLTVYTSASVVPEALFRGVLPTTVVIDRNGEIVLYKEDKGDYGNKKFFAFIDEWLRK